MSQYKSKHRSRVPLACAALVALAGAAGAVSWLRGRAALTDGAGKATPAAPGAISALAGTASPGWRPPPAARVPRFVAPPAPDAAATGQRLDQGDEAANDRDDGAAAQRDELTDGERAAIARAQAVVRARAVAVVGLGPAEAAAIAALRHPLDERNARFEAEIDPATGMLQPLAAAAIRGNARDELRQLERALGRDRARALRDAEVAAYRQLVTADGDAAAVLRRPPVHRMLARRTLTRDPAAAAPRSRVR
jgi:hypothetical protein